MADDVKVAGGVFTVMLDFGAAAFAGEARWLETAVRPGPSTSDFTPLGSRQVLTSAPHALFSQDSAASDSSVTSQSADAAPWAGVTGKPSGFADDVDNDTLAILPCANAGHVAKRNGVAWSCALDGDATGLDWKLAATKRSRRSIPRASRSPRFGSGTGAWKRRRPRPPRHANRPHRRAIGSPLWKRLSGSCSRPYHPYRRQQQVLRRQ